MMDNKQKTWVSSAELDLLPSCNKTHTTYGWWSTFLLFMGMISKWNDHETLHFCDEISWLLQSHCIWKKQCIKSVHFSGSFDNVVFHLISLNVQFWTLSGVSLIIILFLSKQTDVSILSQISKVCVSSVPDNFLQEFHF